MNTPNIEPSLMPLRRTRLSLFFFYINDRRTNCYVMPCQDNHRLYAPLSQLLANLQLLTPA